MFSNLWNWCLRGSYTVYGDILESREVGRTFKLVQGIFVNLPHRSVYFQLLYNKMDFYKWELNLTWKHKWIICKRITEHTCWLLLLLKKYIFVYHLLHSIFSKVLQRAWKTWISPTAEMLSKCNTQPIKQNKK